jgi:mannose-6-phosphate isomerase-like protein (cupin superfamily)
VVLKSGVVLAIVLGWTSLMSAQTSKVPGVVIDHQPASTRQYIGSPSLVIAPDGNYVASHDLFGPGSTSTASAVSRVFLSSDRGATWSKTAEFNDQFWSNLFVVKRRIYLMGSSYEYGRIVIRYSDDNGRSWSAAHFLTEEAGYHTAPVPVVVHDGKIYRAFEFHPAGPWGAFQAFLMWASVDADLTQAASWHFSNRLSFPISGQGNTWLEGNAVVDPHGNVLDILRVNNLSRIAILRLNGDTLAVDRFADFPGGATKFSIRFDPVSKLYWTLSNPALPGEALAISSPASVRNTLAVMSSPDLTHWTPRTIVEHHPDSRLHGFQYVDWQFDGKDIIAASRTAFDDDAGGAHSFHDANYLTFYRVGSFRRLPVTHLKGAPFSTAEVYSEGQMEKWVSATQAGAEKSSSGLYGQAIGEYGNHRTMLTTRTKTGLAEFHRDWNDIFVAVAGEATLLSGGHLEDEKTLSDGEKSGSGVSGGTSQELKPGSVVHIDPGIVHQLVVPPGGSFTYFVVKVKANESH